MDGLDLLKQHWKKDESYPKIDQNEIKQMLHKSSSSIVKWILIICVLELLIGLVFMMILPSENDHSTLINILYIAYEFIFYAAILYFIYRFFILSRRVNNTNSVKSLMENILAVRNNAEQYIKFNIWCIYFIFGAAFIETLFSEFSQEQSLGYQALLIILFTIIFGLFTWGFIKLVKLYYKIVYGILLKKLNKNYEELTQLESE